MSSITVVLPAYNEGAGVKPALENVVRGTKPFPQHRFTLVPVDDGSTDDTWKQLVDWAEDFYAANQYDDEYAPDPELLKVPLVWPRRNPENLGIVRTLKNTYAS